MNGRPVWSRNVVALLSCVSTIFDPSLDQTNKQPFPLEIGIGMNVPLCKAWDERKAGRKRITHNSTIHTPCHHFTPVHQQFLTLIPGLFPWIKQTNKQMTLPPGKWRRYLWMSSYVKPEMKGRPGGRGSHATQPFTRQTAFKAKETCNLNKFNLVSFKKRLHFFSALCLSNPGFLGF